MTATVETRALTVEEIDTVAGGLRADQYKVMHQWVHPLDIVSKVQALEVEIQAIGR